MADGKVRNLAAFREAKRKRRGMEWHFLSGCFDYGIMPTDVDGIVERNGHYLVFEEKQPGIELGVGQKRMLDDLNKNYGMTIFIIWGDTEVPYVEEMSIWRPYGKVNVYQEGRQKIKADIEFLRYKCRQWFSWADRT
jgi:hypothetical protein